MDGTLIGMILDMIVLLFLAATIFVAMRMSANIAAFRNSRKDLEKLVMDLARNIDRAESAIAGMKAASRDAGTELQDRINAARAQADELSIITESGDRLASRLSNDRSRNSASSKIDNAAKRKEPVSVGFGGGGFGGFNIRDREFEDGSDADGVGDDDLPGDDGPDMFHSKAERELFAALNKGRK